MEFEKLYSARLKLVSRRPYMAAAAYALTVVPSPGLGTMAVDQHWRVYVDPSVLEEWTVDEVSAVLEHEINHLLRGHPERMEGKDASVANLATDAEINDDLEEAGLPLPGDPVLPEKLGLPRGRTAEEYYDLLAGRGPDRPEDHGPGRPDGRGNDGQGGHDPHPGVGGGAGADQPGDARAPGDLARAASGDRPAPSTAGPSPVREGGGRGADRKGAGEAGRDPGSSAAGSQNGPSTAREGGGAAGRDPGSSTDGAQDGAQGGSSSGSPAGSALGTQSGPSGADEGGAGGPAPGPGGHGSGGAGGGTGPMGGGRGDPSSLPAQNEGAGESAPMGSPMDADSPASSLPGGSLERRPRPGAGRCGSCATGNPEPWELPVDAAPAVSPAEAEMIRRLVAVRIMEASMSRGDVPEGLRRWAEALLAPPRIDWRRELRSIVQKTMATRAGATDYSYRRPSRRVIDPRVILPTVSSPQPNVAVVVDTSGSVSDRMLGDALGIIRGITKEIGDRVTVLSCDAAVHNVQKVFRPDQIVLVGGGGTDMVIGIEAAERLRPRPDVIIVITDGHTPWPDRPPDRRMVVVLIGAGQAPEWARTIRVEEEEK